jgi:fumarate reductase subunit C
VSGKAESDRAPVVHHYRRPLPYDWWLRNHRYLLYMLRDFSPVPFSLWLLWWLVEISRLKAGPAGYHPHAGPGFVAFSVICLLFALLHSVTFLNLSGVILRIPLGERILSPQLIRGANFGLWAAASALIIAGLIYLARPK